MKGIETMAFPYSIHILSIFHILLKYETFEPLIVKIISDIIILVIKLFITKTINYINEVKKSINKFMRIHIRMRHSITYQRNNTYDTLLAYPTFNIN